MKSILIVEDDIILGNTLSYNFGKKGYNVELALKINIALEKINRKKYDIIILDVLLPDGNGFTICEKIRESKDSHTIIIFLTANDLEPNIIKGYNLGADDYITKPFSFPVLEKKIIAILSRTNHTGELEEYRDKHLKLNFNSLSADIDGINIDFTPLEFQLLKLLIKNSGHIVTRQRILDILWDKRGNYVDDSSLNSIICRIRNKIDLPEYHYIKTVYGTGYMWIGDKIYES